MHRRSLIKCILGLAAAPKILAEMEFAPPIVPQPLLTKSLFRDMQLLTPQFYNSYLEKYGDMNYTQLMSSLSSGIKTEHPEYFWFENRSQKIESNGNETKSS